MDYGELLFALLGELTAREFSLKLARQCSLTPHSVVADPQYEIPADFDLCAHLPLDVSGQRGALLLKPSEAKLLVSEAQRRGTLERRDRSTEGDRHVPLASLLAGVLARPCALLGFLSGEGLHLRGVTVQDTDTPTRRAAHQIAFRRQEMVQGHLHLELHGLTPMSVVLLLPDALFSRAAISLTDPEHLRVTDDLFLEHAPAVGQEVEAWVEEQFADGESPDLAGSAELDRLAAEAAHPEVAALADLLEEVIEDLPEGDQDVVLRSPEDLIFAQMFFPQMLAHVTRRELGCTIRVRAVEMASLSLSSMGDEPAGLLAQIVFQGGTQGDTCLVFPEDALTALATRLESTRDRLVQLVMGPGLALMESITPTLRAQVRPLVPVDFSGYELDGDQYMIRIRYEMVVEEGDVVRFVQYATPVFVSRIVSALAGQDVEFLKGSKRNLMLSFLSLNALMGAVALEDPERAGEWIGPILGGSYVPLYRPGDQLPDMYDFDVLATLPPQELNSLLHWPTIASGMSRMVARAWRFTSGDARRRMIEAGPPQWHRQIPEQDRSRETWSLKDLWEARREFAERLHGGVVNSGMEQPVALAQQIGWRKHRLILAWRLRGPEVLEDGIFVVPFMLDFDSLAELSNRDMTVVLERWVLGKLDLGTLGCALSRPRCPVLPKVLGNVSARRREEIGGVARQASPPEEVFGAQHLFAEYVYFAALKGIIHPARVIQEQIDRYLMLVDEELDGWCSALLRDPTFSRLLAQLDPRELGDVQRLVGREEVLWGLQDAPEGTIALFLQPLGSDARSSFEEDLELIGRREASPQRRGWRIVEARLLAIDAARLVLVSRVAGARPRRS